MTKINKEMSLVDFVKNSLQIIAVLKSRCQKFSEDEAIRYVYNEAMDDAINFVRDMAKSNPAHRLSYMALEREMKKWLPLRAILP